MVLADIALVRGLEVRLACRCIAPGSGAYVGSGRVSAEGDMPSTVRCPPLPVALLGIQEEPVVESTHIGQRPVGHEEDGTDEEIDPVPQASKTGGFDPCAARCGEGPPHARLGPVGRLALRRRHRCQRRILLQPGVENSDGWSFDYGVRVEQEHVAPVTSSAADVDAPSEPEVPARVDIGRTMAHCDGGDSGIR